MVPKPALQVQTSAAGQESAERRNVFDAGSALRDANATSRRFINTRQTADEGRLPDVDDARPGRRHSGRRPLRCVAVSVGVAALFYATLQRGLRRLPRRQLRRQRRRLLQQRRHLQFHNGRRTFS